MNSLRTIDPNLLPTVENGILTFRDLEHFDNYLSFIQGPEMAADTTDPNDTLTSDDKLNILEAELGYTSLRSIINSTWDPLKEEGWASIEEIPEDFFLLGEGNRSVYNTDRNVKVGGQLNHLYNKEFGILLTDPTPALIEKVNNLSPGLTEGQLFSTFAFDGSVRVYHLDRLPAIYLTDRQLKVTADTSWFTDFTIIPMNLQGCNNSDKQYMLKAIGLGAEGVDLFYLFDQYNNNKMDIFVDWGDGTSSTYNNVHVSVTGYSLGTLQITWPNSPSNHTYSTGGTYNVKVKVKKPYHTTWVAETINTLTVPQYLCGPWTSKATSWWWKYSSDGCKAIRGKISTHQNFFGKPVFEAYSESWIKVNNKFKHRKSEKLVVQMWLDVSWDCDGNWNHAQSARWNNNDKSATAKVGNFGQAQSASYSIINSNHRIKNDEETVSLDLTLERCN